MAFFNKSSNKFKIHAGLLKFRISIRAASFNLNDRKDQRKDKFSPGECMLVVLSMQRFTQRWLETIHLIRDLVSKETVCCVGGEVKH